MNLKDYVFVLGEYHCDKHCPYCIAKMNKKETLSFERELEILQKKLEEFKEKNYDENINYEEVKNAGIEIVYIKSSQGTNITDPYFRTNYNNAKQNGLNVGFYHYVMARNEEEAIREAEYFSSVISGTSPDCRLAMDFENFGNLNVEEINRLSTIFLNKNCFYKIGSKQKILFIFLIFLISFTAENPSRRGIITSIKIISKFSSRHILTACIPSAASKAVPPSNSTYSLNTPLIISSSSTINTFIITTNNSLIL